MNHKCGKESKCDRECVIGEQVEKKIKGMNILGGFVSGISIGL